MSVYINKIILSETGIRYNHYFERHGYYNAKNKKGNYSKRIAARIEKVYQKNRKKERNDSVFCISTGKPVDRRNVWRDNESMKEFKVYIFKQASKEQHPSVRYASAVTRNLTLKGAGDARSESGSVISNSRGTAEYIKTSTAGYRIYIAKGSNALLKHTKVLHIDNSRYTQEVSINPLMHRTP